LKRAKGIEVKIYLVEDHPVFRFGLKELIEQEEDLLVCGEAEELAEALTGIEEKKPDMVIVDVALKGRNGLDLVKTLGERRPGLPILVLSMHEESIYAERALRAGALGFIMKHEAADKIITAVRSVLAGGVYLSDKMKSALIGKLARQGTIEHQVPEAQLTDREIEVFEMIGRGMTTKEISDALFLSPKTIGTYRERIKEKLGHRNAMEMQRHAVQWVEANRFGKPSQ